MTPGRAPALLAFGIVAVRCCTAGHAPDVVDAVLAVLAGLALASSAAALPLAWSSASAALVVGASASVGSSRDPWHSLLALSVVVAVVAFLGLGASLALRGPVRAGVVGGATLHAVVALWQRFVAWPEALAHRDEIGLPADAAVRMQGLRPLGLAVSPDLAAAVCLGGLVVAAVIVVDRTTPRAVRTLALGASLVLSAAFVVSRSFGAALAAMVGVGVAVVVARAWRMLAALLVAGGALTVAVLERGVAGLQTSAHERWQNWQVGLDAFADAPWLGQGLLRFAPAYLERRPVDANVTRYGHSFVVQLLAECGVMGAIGVIAALVILAPLVRRALARGDRAVVAVLAGGVAALGVRALIDYDLHVGQTACLFALVLGALAGEGSDVVVDAAPARSTRRSLVVGSGAAAVLLGLLVWRDAAGRGSLLERIDVSVALRHAVLEPDPAERVRLLAPFADASPVAAVLAARAALAAGDVERARAFAAQALRRDPHAEAARQLLQSTSSTGEPAPS